MSEIPSDLRYTKSHEWVRTLPDGSVEIGMVNLATMGRNAGQIDPECPGPLAHRRRGQHHLA